MFRHAITNLAISLLGLYHMLLLSMKGWRYPQVDFVSRVAFAIPDENRRIENLLFNTIKYNTYLTTLLTCLKSNFVLQVGHNEEELRINLFLLVKDTGQNDLDVTGRHFQGTEGLYYFLWDGKNRRLMRDRRLNTVGFFLEDPCFSIRLALSGRIKQEIRDMLKWCMLAPIGRGGHNSVIDASPDTHPSVREAMSASLQGEVDVVDTVGSVRTPTGKE